MTYFTDRDDIEMKLWAIAFVMVVFLGMFAAGDARKFRRREHTITFNGIINSLPGFVSLRVFVSMLSHCTFPFFGFLPFRERLAMYSFTFRALSIHFISLATTFTARGTKPIFFLFVLMELRNGLNFLALGTRFCYDLLRHGFFLIKRLCLEPLQTQYLCGSFNYTTFLSGVK
jgi:hypothetical protein